MRWPIDRVVWAVAGLLALGARSAQADLGALVAPSFDVRTTRANLGDQTTSSHFSEIAQLYRLTLDHELYPLLRINGGGLLDHRMGWATTSVATTQTQNRTLDGFVDLTVGNPFLNGSAGYRWRERYQSFDPGGGSSLVDEDVHMTASWRPVELPSLSLTMSRAWSDDGDAHTRERVRDSLLASARFDAIDKVDLRYAFAFWRVDDVLTQQALSTSSHSASASYGDSFFGRRISLQMGYNLRSENASVATGGAAGTLDRQQIALGGLSVIDRFGALPTQDTLEPNAALIDGILDVSASIDIGYGRQLEGDSDLRALGGRFAEPFALVNTVWVTVDRLLDAEVQASFTWQAYSSDDNMIWSPIAITGPVVFDTLRLRFEIPIEQTRARYVKVATRPLGPAVTTDPDLRAIGVTELQFLAVLPAEEASQQLSFESHIANLSVITRFFEDEQLFHDVSVFLSHTNAAGNTRLNYTVTNGLSYRRAWGRTVGISARVSREDTEQGEGHQVVYRHGAGVTVSPNEALSARLLYSGQVLPSDERLEYSNSVSLVNRFKFYEGVILGATVGVDVARNQLNQDQRTLRALVDASLAPHPMITLNGTYTAGLREASGGDLPDESSRNDVVTAGLSFRPYPLLYITGALSWTQSSSAQARTVGNYGLSFSPFPDGNLLLSLLFTQSEQIEMDSASQLLIASMRWNIRSGTFLLSSYTLSAGTTQESSSITHAFSTRLTVAL